MPWPIRTHWETRPGWSEFGAPRPALVGGRHNGFDYYCPEGTPIFATGPGFVVGVGAGAGPNSFGNHIIILYDDGVRGLYAHMQQKPSLVGRVSAQTQLGTVGHTGSAAPIEWKGLRHVHEELKVNGRFIDPIVYHGAQFAGGDTSPIPEPSQEDDMPRVIHRFPLDGDPQLNGAVAAMGVLSYTPFGLAPGETPPADGIPAEAHRFAELNGQPIITATPSEFNLFLAVNQIPATVARTRKQWNGFGGNYTGPTLEQIAALDDAEFAAVKANIDDQPTTFEVVPKA